MPTFIRVTRDYSYDLDGGERRTLPAGWAGTVEDEVAQAAVDAESAAVDDAAPGAALGDAEAGAPNVAADAAEGAADAAGGGAGAPADVAASEDMTRDELDRRARAAGLNPEDFRTKADVVQAINGTTA